MRVCVYPICCDFPHLLCRYGTNQGSEAQAWEEAEAQHLLTGSPSDLSCFLTYKDTQNNIRTLSIVNMVKTAV